jgi:hypothetical protein
LTPDSDDIRKHLECLGAEFDSELSDLEKATSRAFIRMAEEHMYFHIVLDRWGTEDVWPTIREEYFKAIPKILRGFITRKLRKECLRGMQAQGLGRLNAEERMERLEPDLQAIKTRIWHNAYLFGDYPTSADVSVVAMLSNMRATPGTSLLKMRIAEDEMLCRYIDRMKSAMRKPTAMSPNGVSVSLCA